MAIERVKGKHVAAAKRQAARSEIVEPIPGWRGAVSSPFGRRHNPTGAGTEFHDGVDIAKPTGTPIQAVKDGKVVFAGEAGGYGKLVVIEHADGSFTKYAHQSDIDVSAGQTVKAGDVIGKVGSTGRSTGPHLHFEVRQGNWQSGKVLDPVAYLEGATVTAPTAAPEAPSTNDSSGVSGGDRPSGLSLHGPSSAPSHPRRGGGGASPTPSGAAPSGHSPARPAAPSAPPADAPSRPTTGRRPDAGSARALTDLILADPDIMAAFANWDELTLEEKLALAERISRLIGKALGFTPEDDINRDGKLAKPGESGTVGFFHSKNGISLSDAALASPKEFLNTLVHEQAHKYQFDNNIDMEADHAFNYNLGDRVAEGVFKR